MIAKPLERGLRVALVIAILATLAWRFGDDLTSALLPLFAWEIEAVAPQFRILTMSLGTSGADSVVSAEAAPAAVVLVAGKLLPLAPQSRFQAATLAGHVLQPVILLFAVLVAWPESQWRRYAMRLVAALPFLVLLPLLDVPLVLAAELEATLIDIAKPGMHSALDTWRAFLEGGGRLAMPIAIAIATVALAEARTGTAEKHT